MSTPACTDIPLFPLNAVLFPGGPLRLRIFETRYIDMVRRCMKENAAFGVALIVEGVEAGGPARTSTVGTSARIIDFEHLADGLLGIAALGERCFRIHDTCAQSDGLNIATVEWLTLDEPCSVPEDFGEFVSLLRQALPQLGALYGSIEPKFQDAAWVSYRLLEILPLPLPDKQTALQLRDPLERLRYLKARVLR